MSAPKPPISLSELQRWMKWIVADPRGVNGALEGSDVPIPCPEEPMPRKFDSIVAAPPLSQGQRLSIYAEAYFDRIVEALQLDFETVNLVMGEERFRELAACYLVRHPSHSFTIADCGESLAAFLQDTPFTDEFPFLPDLAALEWSLVEAFNADDVPPLEREALASLSAEEWNRATFALDPSVRLLTAGWSVDQGYHAREAGSEAVMSVIKGVPAKLLIYRKENAVWVDRLDDIPFMMLSSLREGQSLAEMAEAIPRQLNCDPAALTDPFSTYFGHWVNEGIIRGIHVIASM